MPFLFSLSKAAATVPQFIFARRIVSQSTDLVVGGSVVFTQIDASNGTDITLNVSTGIFTLKANKPYRLFSTLGKCVFSSNNGEVGVRWFDITAGSFLGKGGGQASVQFGATIDIDDTADAVFTPSVDTQVELRITIKSNLSLIGVFGSFRDQGPSAYIEVIK